MPVVGLGEGEGEPRILYPLGEKKKKSQKEEKPAEQATPPLPHLAQGLDLPLHVTIKKRARHNGKSLAD